MIRDGGSTSAIARSSNLDALERSGSVAIAVLAATAVVLDSDTLHVHGEVGLAPINWTTSPLTGPIGGGTRLVSGCISTANPVAHLNPHWCLREVFSIKGEIIGIVECAKNVIVDGPFDILGGPIDRVLVPSTNWIGDRVVESPVISCCISLSKEVALH